MAFEKYSLRVQGNTFSAIHFEVVENTIQQSEARTQAEAVSILEDYGASPEDISTVLQIMKPVAA